MSKDSKQSFSNIHKINSRHKISTFRGGNQVRSWTNIRGYKKSRIREDSQTDKNATRTYVNH